MSKVSDFRRFSRCATPSCSSAPASSRSTAASSCRCWRSRTSLPPPRRSLSVSDLSFQLSRARTPAGVTDVLPSAGFFVTAEMQQVGGVETKKKKSGAVKALEGQCQWGETFHFLLGSLEQPCSLSVRLYSYSSVRRKRCLGQVRKNV